jgi:hypothetical protein
MSDPQAEHAALLERYAAAATRAAAVPDWVRSVYTERPPSTLTPPRERAMMAEFLGRFGADLFGQDSDEPDCTVCDLPGSDAVNPVTQWFDPEADRYVAAHDECAEAEGYRRSA